MSGQADWASREGVQVALGHRLLPLSLPLCCCCSQRTLRVCRPVDWGVRQFNSSFLGCHLNLPARLVGQVGRLARPCPHPDLPFQLAAVVLATPGPGELCRRVTVGERLLHLPDPGTSGPAAFGLGCRARAGTLWAGPGLGEEMGTDESPLCTSLQGRGLLLLLQTLNCPGRKGSAPGGSATVLSWIHLICGSLLCHQKCSLRPATCLQKPEG